MNKKFWIILKSGKNWLRFSDAEQLVAAYHQNEVLPRLKHLDGCLRQGKYIAGFISYEAAPGLDLAFTTKDEQEFPLMFFGVFNKPKILSTLPESKEKYETGKWKPSQSPDIYSNNVKIIKDHISKGNTYQVNYTMRLAAEFGGSPYALFYQLVQNQKADYAAYIEFNNYCICSVSPELFFTLDNDNILSRPMKGTAKRGFSYEDDIIQKDKLFHSQKERAENLMIVDMIRNDIGKICKSGSVKVNQLFSTERYPTIWQMTSDVSGKTSAPFSDVISALFPCASITGAPKARTMNIIGTLEQTSRKIYTGTIGYFSPERKAQFNVAIRTVLINENTGKAEYGVGSGIVWDSVDKNEYRECLLKAKVLEQEPIEFDLLETMLATKNEGIFLLDYHLRRMKNSAEYFNYSFDEKKIHMELDRILSNPFDIIKLRLLLSENGTFKIESYPIHHEDSSLKKVVFAKNSLDSNNIFIYHKTTNRKMYESAVNHLKSSDLKIDDVLLYNEKDEITESTIANIVIKKNNIFYTPPVTCGLLNGTYRQYLLDQKKIAEKIIYKEDLLNSDGLFLINSVQKWQKAEIF